MHLGSLRRGRPVVDPRTYEAVGRTLPRALARYPICPSVQTFAARDVKQLGSRSEHSVIPCGFRRVEEPQCLGPVLEASKPGRPLRLVTAGTYDTDADGPLRGVLHQCRHFLSPPLLGAPRRSSSRRGQLSTCNRATRSPLSARPAGQPSNRRNTMLALAKSGSARPHVPA